jgi:uncharacterized membrane protein (DUF373 family)
VGTALTVVEEQGAVARSDRDPEDASAMATTADRWGGHAEALVYIGVAVLLIAGAVVLLVDAAGAYFADITDGVAVASIELLSALLLVFIFVELLGATRLTIRERRLIAEPFLLVGIIASIKEIVLVAGAERPKDESWSTFRDSMVEVGVLAGVVLVLSISALLLRRREREPTEESA